MQRSRKEVALQVGLMPDSTPGGRKHHVHVDSVIEAAVGPVANYQVTAFVE